MGFSHEKAGQQQAPELKRRRQPYRGGDNIYLGRWALQSANSPTSPLYTMNNIVKRLQGTSVYLRYEVGGTVYPWTYTQTTASTPTLNITSNYWIDLMAVVARTTTQTIQTLSVNGGYFYRYGSDSFSLPAYSGIMMDIYGYGANVTVNKNTNGTNVTIVPIMPWTSVTSGGYMVTPNGSTNGVKPIRDAPTY